MVAHGTIKINTSQDQRMLSGPRRPSVQRQEWTTAWRCANKLQKLPQKTLYVQRLLIGHHLRSMWVLALGRHSPVKDCDPGQCAGPVHHVTRNRRDI